MTETAETNPAAIDMTDPGPARPRPRTPCPRCGKLLTLRTLAEKHICGKKTREPRTGRRMDPDKKFERQKAAAVRRFERRIGQEPVPDATLMDQIDGSGATEPLDALS